MHGSFGSAENTGWSGRFLRVWPFVEYSCLSEMHAVARVDAGAESLGQPAPQTGIPSRMRIHAVQVIDGPAVCAYERQPRDTAEAGRDWMSVHPGERCGRCGRTLGVDGWL